MRWPRIGTFSHPLASGKAGPAWEIVGSSERMRQGPANWASILDKERSGERQPPAGRSPARPRVTAASANAPPVLEARIPENGQTRWSSLGGHQDGSRSSRQESRLGDPSGTSPRTGRRWIRSWAPTQAPGTCRLRLAWPTARSQAKGRQVSCRPRKGAEARSRQSPLGVGLWDARCGGTTRPGRSVPLGRRCASASRSSSGRRRRGPE